MNETELKFELARRLAEKFGSAVKPSETMIKRLLGVPLDDPDRLLLSIQVLSADVEILQERLR